MLYAVNERCLSNLQSWSHSAEISQRAKATIAVTYHAIQCTKGLKKFNQKCSHRLESTDQYDWEILAQFTKSQFSTTSDAVTHFVTELQTGSSSTQLLECSLIPSVDKTYTQFIHASLTNNRTSPE